MLRNLAYTKTIAVLALVHFGTRLVYFIATDPRPMLPEYASLWRAIAYGPLGDVVGDVVIMSLTLLILGIPIGLVMDLVAWFRRLRLERRSQKVYERQWQ